MAEHLTERLLLDLLPDSQVLLQGTAAKVGRGGEVTGIDTGGDGTAKVDDLPAGAAPGGLDRTPAGVQRAVLGDTPVAGGRRVVQVGPLGLGLDAAPGSCMAGIGDPAPEQPVLRQGAWVGMRGVVAESEGWCGSLCGLALAACSEHSVP
jgi:hypothetical protein